MSAEHGDVPAMPGPEPTRITIVRHGETDWNAEGRIQGSSDVPLNDTGRAQAAETGAALAGRRYHAVYSSPLSRARETAEIIARSVEVPDARPAPVPHLSERAYGEHEGLTRAEIDARFPPGAEVPGREDVPAVLARTTDALAELAERHPGERLLVVSHGAVIGALLRDASDGDLPPEGGGVRNASAHELTVTGRDVVVHAFDVTADEPPSPPEREADAELEVNPVAESGGG